jgi:hypothetical protein
MSDRLGRALVERIRRLEGDSKYVLVEAVAEAVALAMSQAWDDSDDRLPTLAVAAASSESFTGHSLVDQTGTGLRNLYSGGVCRVICEGAFVPDRQSLNSFENLAPSDLLRDPEGLMLLAQVPPAVPMDSAANEARKAVAQLATAHRPSAQSVATYFDRVAGGEPPLRALPSLGCFRDDAQGERVDSTRIRENILLAERRQADDLRLRFSTRSWCWCSTSAWPTTCQSECFPSPPSRRPMSMCWSGSSMSRFAICSDPADDAGPTHVHCFAGSSRWRDTSLRTRR